MLYELFEIIQDRQMNPTPGSYTVQLLESGTDKILKKIGEENVEVLLAAKGQGRKRLVEEVSDLYYHLLVLLVSKGIELLEIEAELRKRHEG